MKIKSVYLVYTLCVVLFGLTIDSAANDSSNVTLSTPEATLGMYIDAVRKGDEDKVLEYYYSDQKDFRISLPYPIDITKYKIVKKKIYTKQMADKYIAIPKAKIGDVEFYVREYINGRKWRYVYLLRQINNEWRIISHNNLDDLDSE
ncbi:MAG: hypothetical protein LLF86_04365 [Nitrospiraceae bacterium]|nr:hypothetical protein [Nitrospiraceae bacterium]